MGKATTIDSFFKRKNPQNHESPSEASEPIQDTSASISIQDTSASISQLHRPAKISRVEKEEIDLSCLEKDSGLRRPILEYPIEQRDKIRRAYIIAGPYQPKLEKYPLSGTDKHRRSFQESWYDKFSSWLEYSPVKDAAFCLPCYIFYNASSGRFGTNSFTEIGFRNWKKINDGNNCVFLKHIGTSFNSSHNQCVKACDDLMVQSQHIDKVLHKQSAKMIAENRLRLKTSIDAIRWLTFQACALRGNDESTHSLNRGNFIELVKLLGSYNSNVGNVVLDKAPGNAQYISPSIQKQILHIFGRKIRTIIREETGDAKYCIIIDEARDESKREQMSIVLRYVDKECQVQERFFDIVHVSDTSSLNLKNEINAVLSRHNLHVQNMRGQGYDGASNMRGEWNGLQALFMKECPYAYYVHCFAHRLQLALVAAAREVSPVHNFFTQLTFIINIVSASCKRNDQLRDAQASIIAGLIANDELETGTGLNQIGTLQRLGETRWSSHLASTRSILKMYNATYSVLQIIAEEGNYSQRGDATAACDAMISFEFVFILHLMKDILEITHDLCQALQLKCQDILNALSLVSTTKTLIQRKREIGWEPFLDGVKSFCEKHDIDIPDMNLPYVLGRGRGRHPKQPISMEHHYRINLFIATIDTQWQELNSRFNEKSMELLTLVSTFDPRENFKLFNIEHIMELASKFYPMDFTDQELLHLKLQAKHYELDVREHLEFKQLSTIAELARQLKITRKDVIYSLISRLLHLILTLPVTTATTERSFSAMKLVKNRLRSKMEDEYLADCLITYIERRIAEKIDTDSIINEFYDMKERRVQLR